MDQRKPWVIFTFLLLASFTVYEAMSFQAAAIPSISKFFGVSVGVSALIQVSFYLGCTIFMPILGRVADVYGRRRMLLFGMAAFAVSEALAAVSPTYPIFLIARFIQGLGSAVVIPIPIAYAALLFPGEGRGKALGLYTLFSSMGAMIGAFLSGILVDSYGWPSIYWFSMGIAVIGFFVVFLVVPETESRAKVPYDFAGAVALFIGVGCILSISNLISAFGLSSPLVLLAIIGVFLGLTAFWFIEMKVSYPIIDIEILKRREFHRSGLVAILAVVVMNGSVYMLSYFLQRAMGGGASYTATVLMFLYAATATAGISSGWLTERVSPRYVINSGIILAMIGVVLFSRINLTSPTWYIIISVVILGFGVVGCLPAINKTGISVMDSTKMSAGAGTLHMMKELGSPLGSAFSLTVFGTQTVTQTNNMLLTKLREANLPENLITAVLQLKSGAQQDPGLMNQLSTHGVNLAELLKTASAEGMVIAMRNVSLALLALAAVVLLISFTIPAIRPDRSPNSETSDKSAKC